MLIRRTTVVWCDSDMVMHGHMCLMKDWSRLKRGSMSPSFWSCHH